jgi:hypothetical protein
MLRSFFIAVFIAMIPSLAVAENTDGWQEISNSEGIQVLKKEVKGSDTLAFRGVAVINASMDKISSVLKNTARKKDWVDNVASIRLVRQVNALERVEYLHASIPWPFKDRDFVYQTTTQIDLAARRMIMSARSIEEPNVPEYPDKVRAVIFNTQMTLTALGDGSRTHVIGELHADPKGSIPKWLANLIQKRWPRNTLKGLMAQVKKDQAETK